MHILVVFLFRNIISMHYIRVRQKLTNVCAHLRHTFLHLPLPQRVIYALLALTLCSFLIFDLWQVLRSDIAPVTIGTAIEATEATTAVDIPGNYIRRRLDGVYVDPKEANYYPLAVMIDNDPNARPQTGLARAQIVYEALAEGAITRFMAIFASATSTPDEIGPVRSARPYFVDWAQGYNALYAHVGGSPEALAELTTIAMHNINEFYQGKYFWRAKDRLPPHNVLGSAGELYAYLENLNAYSSNYRSWQYKDEAPAEERGGQNIEINYNNPLFAVAWQYDKEQNQYRRFMADSPHNDADGTPITTKNIILLKVSSQVVDAQLRRHMQNIGDGKAWYCLDGTCDEGTWKKPSLTEREVIYNAQNEEVKFNTGTTWIEVVQYEGNITISE